MDICPQYSNNFSGNFFESFIMCRGCFSLSLSLSESSPHPSHISHFHRMINPTIVVTEVPHLSIAPSDMVPSFDHPIRQLAWVFENFVASESSSQSSFAINFFNFAKQFQGFAMQSLS